MVEKTPPAYMVEPLIARAKTGLFASGFQLVAEAARNIERGDATPHPPLFREYSAHAYTTEPPRTSP